MPLRKQNIQANAYKAQLHDFVWNVRTRFTIAEVNAGTVILPADPKGKYRLVDIGMIAVGGAAATQPVRLRGVQGGVNVDLVSNAVAQLTQNTLLRAGFTGSTILAAGASFVANDKNTPLTIISAGVTGATHIDVIMSYVIESDALLSSGS